MNHKIAMLIAAGIRENHRDRGNSDYGRSRNARV